jgi:hypothetical protein
MLILDLRRFAAGRLLNFECNVLLKRMGEAAIGL